MTPRLFMGMLAVIAVISIIIGIFRIGGSDGGEVLPAESIDITTYAETSAAVSYQKRGQINALEDHIQIKISVTNTDRILRVVRGYDGRVIRSERYTNTVNSYDEFLHALASVDFLKEKSNIQPEQLISTGACPFGNVYTYEAQRLGAVIKKTWSSSCGTSQGTSAGAANSIRRLFESQIPDYAELTRNLL